jgi:uncharacterized protein YqeY
MMNSNKTDAAEALRERLQSDLRSAMRARALAEVSVLRQLIAVIDNAGAVPPPTKTEPLQCEVERRFLNRDDIQALLQREIDVRQHATHVFRTLGRAVEAEATKFEMDIVGRYLLSLNGDTRKLADAQQLLANDYGFASWAKLKSFTLQQQLSPAEALKVAVCDRDAPAVAEVLSRNPELKAILDRPLPGYGFGQHALIAAVQRSDRATIDILLQSGANIKKRTEWWAGGFGVLDDCDPSVADFLIERGAELDAHSAARLGRIEELQKFIAADPAVVHGRGGDGQTPLHFASSVAVAELLLATGADMNALDVDHESTPAQYMLRVEQRRHYPQDRQSVARYLIQKGCKTDLLMAAALGDLELAREHLECDPGCIYMTVSAEWFPMRDPRAGGTIYIWQLGRNRTAHTVARDFGHENVFRFLLAHTPEDLKIGLASELGDFGHISPHSREETRLYLHTGGRRGQKAARRGPKQ